MSLLQWVILAVFLSLIVYAVRTEKIPQFFHSRSCQGKFWKSAFPHAGKVEIREFLSLFTEAFALPDQYKLQIHPNDEIFVIYKMLYPPTDSKWKITGVDGCELESLVQRMDKRYGIQLETIWNQQLTLGELFCQTSRPRLNTYRLGVEASALRA